MNKIPGTVSIRMGSKMAFVVKEEDYPKYAHLERPKKEKSLQELLAEHDQWMADRQKEIDALNAKIAAKRR